MMPTAESLPFPNVLFFSLATILAFVAPPVAAAEREETSAQTAEQILSKRLSSLYGPNAFLPPARGEEAKRVELRFTLYHVKELNEKHQYLDTNFYIFFKWEDPSLSWNPEDYANLTSIKMPAESVPRPDMVLSNQMTQGNVPN